MIWLIFILMGDPEGHEGLLRKHLYIFSQVCSKMVQMKLFHPALPRAQERPKGVSGTREPVGCLWNKGSP